MWKAHERKFSVVTVGPGSVRPSNPKYLDMDRVDGYRGHATAGEVREMITMMDHGSFSELHIRIR